MKILPYFLAVHIRPNLINLMFVCCAVQLITSIYYILSFCTCANLVKVCPSFVLLVFRMML